VYGVNIGPGQGVARGSFAGAHIALSVLLSIGIHLLAIRRLMSPG